MGQFRVTVVAVGNHGCGRTVQSGGVVPRPCGNAGCTDCLTLDYVEKLKASGAQVQEASVQHWPGTHGEVLDNLLTGERAGSF